jgi:hypothetical protein
MDAAETLSSDPKGSKTVRFRRFNGLILVEGAIVCIIVYDIDEIS